MTPDTIAIWGFVALFVLALLRVPVGVAMGVVGFGGVTAMMTFDSALSLLSLGPLRMATDYSLALIPLFVLMGAVAGASAMSSGLYTAANAWLGHRKGGVAMSTIVACGGFSAICGSSVATAATMARVALPEMKRFGYPDSLATGTVAAGGTLGILIPPSAPMVLYAYVTETSVAALFLAGVVPGLMMALMFAAYCFITEGKAKVPADEPPPESAHLAVMRAGWSLSLPIFVLGGIYLGIFTATEAAGTGTIYALVIALLIYRTLTWRDMLDGVAEATRTSAMLLMIIAGAAIYGYMLTKLRIPQELTELVAHLGLGRTGFLIAMMVLLFLLGLVLESFSIILLTMPAILPLLGALGIDKVWYGILLTLSLEMALISPPVALNLVVIKAITGAPLSEVNRSIIPYMLMLAFGTALLIIFPDIALWLPRQAGYGG